MKGRSRNFHMKVIYMYIKYKNLAPGVVSYEWDKRRGGSRILEREGSNHEGL